MDPSNIDILLFLLVNVNAVCFEDGYLDLRMFVLQQVRRLEEKIERNADFISLFLLFFIRGNFFVGEFFLLKADIHEGIELSMQLVNVLAREEVFV